MDRRLMSFRWSCPVAHLVGDFPRELLRAVTCPPTQDVAAAGGLAGPLQMAPRPHGHGSGGIGDDGDVFSREGEPPADMEVTAQDPPVRWDFAPYIFEPRSQQLYRLARHPSLGQVWEESVWNRNVTQGRGGRSVPGTNGQVQLLPGKLAWTMPSMLVHLLAAASK